ncbi:DUF2752 domain-containing protein [uncultured Rikenella sp.]|uniref:DUF2752 domain-containing protein n=1 Tax=uncultured Rikenella sp. TaxID=368003 RepID=UPI0025D994E9|nr:DUF2752 domain-containing protein [uncultured Rikenella sp.]
MPCAYRQLFGFDCPFCGAQRAVLLLLQGRFRESFLLFPALLPLGATLLVIRHRRLLQIMLWVDLAILLGSWVLRLILN